jgi:hypothetical protein
MTFRKLSGLSAKRGASQGATAVQRLSLCTGELKL